MKMNSLLPAALLLVIFFSTGTAEEGLVINSKLNCNFMGMGGETSQMVDFITDNKTRNECVSEPYGLSRFDPESNAESTLSIEDYGSQTAWNIDLLANTYDITDLSPMPDDSQGPIDTGFVSFKFPQDTSNGEYTWITTLDASNVPDTINGYPCYRVSLYSCCKPSLTDSMLMVTNIWICDSFPAMNIYRNYQINQRHGFGLNDFAGVAESDLDDVEGFRDILKLHLKELVRRSLVFGRIIMKFDLNAKAGVGLFNAPDELSTAGDSPDSMDSTSNSFETHFLTMFQKLFGSGSNDSLINFISFSNEVINLEKRNLADSLFVLPKGLMLKNETTTR